MTAEAVNTSGAGVENAPAAPGPASVRVLWPLGVLAVGGAAMIAGAVWAVRHRPEPVMESPLRQVCALRDAGQLEAALNELNTKALAYVNLPGTDAREIRDFFVLRARTLQEAQAQAGASRRENYQSIASDYEAGEARGAELDASDTVRLAEAYLGLDRVSEALERVQSLPKTERERRRSMLKTIVERGIRDKGRTGLGASQVLDLLLGLANEPDLPAEDAAWSLARQAELLIGIGTPEDASTRLMREMQHIRGASQPAMGELYFLLGKALYAQGDAPEAARQLERSMGLLGPLDPMQAPARLMTARMMQSDGQVEGARDRYREVIKSFKGTPEYLPSLYGLASVLATLGEEDESLATYAELVEALDARGAGRGSSEIDGLAIRDVSSGLMARHDERAAGDYTREALRYALMAESLYPPDRVPAPVLLALGASSRRLGDELLGKKPGGDQAGDAESVDRASREEARKQYLAAAEYYRRHARATIVEDQPAASRSYWEAADAYDAAGETDAAINEFNSYIQSASDNDPRRWEGKFRLAQAFHATGDLKTAESLYRELIDARHPADASSGQNDALLWGDRSIVPLARCYSLDNDPANDAEAETLLLDVMSGRDLAPEAAEFRDALVELGELYYRRERYADAATRLAEAEKRFPNDRDLTSIRYRLADSLRLSAGQIDAALRDAVPQADRLDMEKARRLRRREAIRLFGLVRGSLDTKPAKSLTDLERVLLRNSVFYQGDCAYDLGDFEAAIGYYDDAKQRYSQEPASLVAMVQIVNAYVQRGEWAKAATANQRAVQHLEKFPDSAWSQPNLPMEKKHWARWLDTRALLDQRQQASAGKE
ncbi:MAG: tetratricopeptide repeat protein [Phycisphaerales bacterium]